MLEYLIAHDLVLSASYRCLLAECKNEKVEPFGVIASGDNGVFVLLLDDVPVIVHKLQEGFEFPVHLVVCGQDGHIISMTVDPLTWRDGSSILAESGKKPPDGGEKRGGAVN